MYWPNIAGHPWLSSKTLCAHLAVFRGTIRVWHLPLYWRIVLYIVHCIVSYIVLYLVVPLLQEGVYAANGSKCRQQVESDAS